MHRDRAGNLAAYPRPAARASSGTNSAALTVPIPDARSYPGDAGTAAARDAADFQPVIAPADRTVPGSPPGSHAWHAWPLP